VLIQVSGEVFMTEAITRLSINPLYGGEVDNATPQYVNKELIIKHPSILGEGLLQLADFSQNVN